MAVQYGNESHKRVCAGKNNPVFAGSRPTKGAAGFRDAYSPCMQPVHCATIDGRETDDHEQVLVDDKLQTTQS